MNKVTKNKENSFKVLVYGSEKLNYYQFKELLVGDRIKLLFGKFDTLKKFQDFDGVIMFQGIWATWEVTQYTGKDYLANKQNDELNKRIKQLQLLLEKGGFICFLMGGMRFDDFDLAKEALSWFSSTQYEDIPDRRFLKIYRDELKSFIDSYGVAKTKYSHYGNLDYKVIVTTTNDEDVGVCFERKIFFLPCHAPDKDKESTEELFKKLGNGLVSLFKKYQQEIPEWVNDYKFSKEDELLNEKKKTKTKLDEINNNLNIFMNYKRPIALTGELLRDSVADILEEGFGFTIDRKDEFKEDLKIIFTKKDEITQVKALIEVKGINGNVNRESINQVDSHRERRGFKDDLPGILIANTFMKSSNSIKNKDKPINKEQIKHAKRINVLILRTIDLIRALDIVLEDKKQFAIFKKYIFDEKGWLEVKDDKFIIH